MNHRFSMLIGTVTGAVLLAGCTPSDKKAAINAATAQGALDRGQLNVARIYIQRALAIRDDVSDYWLILAHISLAKRDPGGAFDAYQNVLQLDRANLEALNGVCQIALTGNAAQRAEKYADQLALITPGSTLPNTVKAAAAAERDDEATANHFLDLVFAVNPGDLNALMVKSRMLAKDQKYAEAAKVVEQSLSTPGGGPSRFMLLLDYYERANDRDGLMRTFVRLAKVSDDPAVQMQYADLLYDQGSSAEASGVINRTLRAHPDDIGLAAQALNAWLKAGRDGIPTEHLLATAAGAPLAMKAALAQYASETGHADLAVRILSDDGLATAPADRPVTAEAIAALGYARGLTGDRNVANALLARVLTVDPDQPRALLARGRLRAAAGDLRGGIEDVRQSVAQDGSNVAARLALADLLVQNHQQVLAETALHDGMDAITDDARLPARLARLLVSEGRRDAASVMLGDFARANPISLRAKRLGQSA